MVQPYTYSALVAVYYAEATKSLAARNYFSAIATAWAAVDYAIDFELKGGSKFHPQTNELRKPEKFNPKSQGSKRGALWKIFPRLRKWDGTLLEMYELYRNTFLHAKSSNLQSVSDGNLTTTSLPTELTGRIVMTELLIGTLDHRQNSKAEHIDQEGRILGMVPLAAVKAVRDADRFLKDLNAAVANWPAATP